MSALEKKLIEKLREYPGYGYCTRNMHEIRILDRMVTEGLAVCTARNSTPEYRRGKATRGHHLDCAYIPSVNG